MGTPSLKKTTFIEAIAAGIEYEKKCFDFYLRMSDSLPNGGAKTLFTQLAESGDEHIEHIKEIHKHAVGKELPNLKQLTAIHKFHTTTIMKLMEKLERNMKAKTGSMDELTALETAIRIGQDARNFYNKVQGKFKDPNVNMLFHKLMQFVDSNLSLIQAQSMSIEQTLKPQTQFYWEDTVLLDEVSPKTSPKPQPKKAKTAPSKKSPAKKKR